MKYMFSVYDGKKEWFYSTSSRNAKKVASEYGHKKAGEVITVYKGATSKPISRAVWDVETCKYIREE